MKLIFWLLILPLFWMNSCSPATDPPIETIVQQSLQTGNAEQLMAYCNPTIELIIDSETIDFPAVSAAHAEFIVKSFFRKYPPRRFRYVYQATNGHQHYSTGIYQTGQEQFQVYILTNQTISDPAGTPTRVAAVGAAEPPFRIGVLHFRKVN